MKKQYNYLDWKEFLKANKLRNKNISEITGVKITSIRSAIGKQKELPIWAIVFIWTWKNISNG